MCSISDQVFSWSARAPCYFIFSVVLILFEKLGGRHSAKCARWVLVAVDENDPKINALNIKDCDKLDFATLLSSHICTGILPIPRFKIIVQM